MIEQACEYGHGCTEDGTNIIPMLNGERPIFCKTHYEEIMAVLNERGDRAVKTFNIKTLVIIAAVLALAWIMSGTQVRIPQ